MSKFAPSKYQQDIFDWVNETQSGSLVVEALAGSGKTTTGIEIFRLLSSEIDAIFVAFNKHIADELSRRLPAPASARTYHSLGLGILRSNFGRVDVDNKKVDKILERFMPRERNYWKFHPIRKLTGLVKANLSPTDHVSLESLALYYGIDLNNGIDPDEIFDAVRKVVKESAEWTSSVDFNDMCWLPIHLDLPARQYDFLFVDELQDTNTVQTELVMKSIAPDGRIIAVGDRRQSIYSFAGAGAEAIPQFINRTNADTLPLSITYRNPKNVVDLVTKTFPDIHLEFPEWAIDGEVVGIDEKTASDEYNDGDMVLCRVNAPLVRPCFALIREGKKATIRGRDIGKNLANLVKKMKADDMHILMTRLRDYRLRETSKLIDSDKFGQAALLDDKVDTIIAIADGCEDVTDVTNKIASTFSDEVEGVVFSSIHKAKGLEAKNIFLLKPDLLPHPMAKQPWELQQERNLQYVAYTRTLEKLSIVL
ncbi:MAG: ATP-dependent DNA helicase PcrA [Chlamydiae bacterium]|nr:ATP-dependent DNA helicase PcrA [Chlamydiota bacterium]